MSARRDARIITAPRRGLRRDEAALYVGVSPSKFDELVRRGDMPSPLTIDRCVVWDVEKLAAAFDELDENGNSSDRNPWEEE